jgi:hypothetical protein
VNEGGGVREVCGVHEALSEDWGGVCGWRRGEK